MKNEKIEVFFFFFLESPHFIWVCFSGGSGSADFAILIFPAGNAVWDSIPALLWLDGKLDSLSHQHPLC